MAKTYTSLLCTRMMFPIPVRSQSTADNCILIRSFTRDSHGSIFFVISGRALSFAGTQTLTPKRGVILALSKIQVSHMAPPEDPPAADMDFAQVSNAGLVDGQNNGQTGDALGRALYLLLIFSSLVLARRSRILQSILHCTSRTAAFDGTMAPYICSYMTDWLFTTYSEVNALLRPWRASSPVSNVSSTIYSPASAIRQRPFQLPMAMLVKSLKGRNRRSSELIIQA